MEGRVCKCECDCDRECECEDGGGRDGRGKGDGVDEGPRMRVSGRVRMQVRMWV